MQFIRRKAYKHRLERRFYAQKRKQFNFSCDEGIVFGVKLLASVLEVPNYCVAEHALQIGAKEMLKQMEDGKEEELQRHLVDTHLLSKEEQSLV
jgi:hypothetical protein